LPLGSRRQVSKMKREEMNGRDATKEKVPRRFDTVVQDPI
jgi:hypothetical protein